MRLKEWREILVVLYRIIVLVLDCSVCCKGALLAENLIKI